MSSYWENGAAAQLSIEQLYRKGGDIMHTLIVGARKSGKSTLIRKVLKELGVSVCGFETKKEQKLADSVYGDPIYIYEPGTLHRQTEENKIGYCKKQHSNPDKSAFDRFSEKFRQFPDGKDMILMDEIGFMETCSEDFCRGILSALDGDTPVIAAVKDKDTPFLNQIRSYKNCKCFYITQDNRDQLTEEVTEFVRQQLKC